MKITFEIPEIFVTFSFVFLLKGMYWIGGSFMAAGLFLSLCRFSLEIQRKKEEETRKLELLNQLAEGVTSLFTNSNFSNKNSSNKFH